MSDLGIIVEDDEDLASIFTEALENADYQVETIRDGLSAQRRLFEIEPHIVILDMHIPFEFPQALVMLEPHTPRRQVARHLIDVRHRPRHRHQG